MMETDARGAPELGAEDLARLFAFAFLACGSRSEALGMVAAVLQAAQAGPRDAEALLRGLVERLEQALGRKASHRFVVLDNLLRVDPSRILDLDAPPISGDLSRLPALLAALKSACLGAALGCLPPACRIAFIAVDVLGHTNRAAAALLQIREGAVHVRLTRARRGLADYLGPRCGHVDRANFCSCAGRLGVALDNGFIELSPDGPSPTADVPPTRDIGALYRSLPGTELDESERRSLLALLAEAR